MKPTDLLSLLREFSREKLAMRQRHVAVARLVSDYEFNNAYQYVINREDTQLAWLDAALVEAGGTPESVAEPALAPLGRKESFLQLVQDDARGIDAFVAKWRPCVDAMTQARHKTMLTLVLGEMLEQKRFFDQMIAGRDDLLGRRHANVGTGDGVLGTRWLG